MPTTNPTGFVPSVVDNLALPCLTKTTASACVTACGGVVWLSCDSLCSNDSRATDRPSATAEAVVVFASVAIKDVGAYSTAWKKHAELAQSTVPGVRAMFSFIAKAAGDAGERSWSGRLLLGLYHRN